MAKINTSPLSGFMELTPADQITFNRLLETIKSSYERFGFIPVDTPLIERAEVLLAKAGGETEKQIYRFSKGDDDLALRFDLTVPLSRYVCEHYADIVFPFKRYHIGKVYRGERAQKGRYREFYQCDIDIIGDGSLGLVNDAEILGVIYTTFTALNFGKFIIRINNRKILSGCCQAFGCADKMTDVLRIIDKLEKIGNDAVTKELVELGLSPEDAQHLLGLLALRGSIDTITKALQPLAQRSEILQTGLSELQEVVKYLPAFNVSPDAFRIDLSIARGLDYYTGTVYETSLDGYPELGSICSGGRYDNLTEFYSNRKMPGVGISIGLTRLFSQLKSLGLLATTKKVLSDVIVIPFIEDLSYPLTIATQLRQHGINTEVYVENVKIKKKLDYANKQGIEWAIIIGQDEVDSKILTIKNMKTGEQVKGSAEDVCALVTQKKIILP